MGRQLVEMNLRSQFPHTDRKQWRGQIFLQACFQPERRTGGSPHMDFNTLAAQWGEEGQALNVIHVQMGEQDVNLRNMWRQALSQISDAGTSVQYKETLLWSFHCYAGCVATIAGRIRARRSERATCSPKRHLHVGFSQKMAMAPRKRSACPTSGKAVTSISRKIPSKPSIQNNL